MLLLLLLLQLLLLLLLLLLLPSSGSFCLPLPLAFCCAMFPIPWLHGFPCVRDVRRGSLLFAYRSLSAALCLRR